MRISLFIGQEPIAVLQRAKMLVTYVRKKCKSGNTSKSLHKHY